MKKHSAFLLVGWALNYLFEKGGMKSRVNFGLMAIFCIFLMLSLTACGGDGGGNSLAPLLPIERVSADSAGAEATGRSLSPSISADGRYIAFISNASDLVVGDINEAWDVFVHDRQTGATTRVSVDSDGVEANGDSSALSISADGRYVAFGSVASNLVAGDTNGITDIFVHDRQTGATTRVSIDSDGVEANNDSSEFSISADGRYVAFGSVASNLVAGDTNGATDVFVHDRLTGTTTRVSVNSAGVEANAYCGSPSISADGRYVVFVSNATNLVAGHAWRWYVFVHDRQTGATTLVSVDSAGGVPNDDSTVASISADGRYVAFISYATNIVAGDTNVDWDVFVHDRQTGATTRVSVDSDGVEANGDSSALSISADGRYVAILSTASNLVAGDTNLASDIFVHDRQTGTTTRVSVGSDGVEANGDSGRLSISADGRYIAFSSFASNFVAGDTNAQEDVFVAPNK